MGSRLDRCLLLEMYELLPHHGAISIVLVVYTAIEGPFLISRSDNPEGARRIEGFGFDVKALRTATHSAFLGLCYDEAAR